MNGEKLWKALGDIDDRYLDMVDALEQEQVTMKYEKKHTSVRRIITVLTAAALAVSLLTVTAFAAGWVPGIFRAMKEKTPEDENLYEAAAQANSEAKPDQVEITEIPELNLSNFTLFERYYDGETILLGYDLGGILPEPVITAEPTNVTLEELQSGNSFENIGWEEMPPWESAPMTENAKAQGLTGGAERMDRMFQHILSENAYAELWKILKEEGHVCLMTYDTYISDHIWVNEADIGEVLSDEVGNMRWDYQVEEGSCIKLNPLPEAGRNQAEVTVTMNLRSLERYYYLDLNGNTMTYTANPQTQPLEFTLENVNQK